MTTEQFYEDIALDRNAIVADSLNGSAEALEVIQLHRMHVACPNDPGALGLCMAAYENWRKEYLSPNALKRKGA